ncbi:hypothetical protein BRC76_06130, partial [Halobacteriales archaeon QH_8_67_36]
MSAAGLSDVYRYGVRFVGYLLAVTLVSNAFVVGGAIIGDRILPTVVGGGATATSNVAAIALFAIGVLLLLSGLFGLAYKLVADATMAGVAQGRAVGTGVTASDDGSETDDGDAQSAGTAETAAVTETVDDESAETTGGAVDPPSDDGEPAPDQPATAADDAIAEAQTVVEDPSEPPEQPADSQDAQSDSPASSEPTPDQPDAWVADEDPLTTDESVADEEPLATDEPADAGEANEADAPPSELSGTNEWADQSATPGDDDEATASDETRPEEWSPPDPSEFETEPADESDDGDGTPGWDMADGDEESPDGPRTADDLFGEATDDGEDVSNLFATDDTDPSP